MPDFARPRPGLTHRGASCSLKSTNVARACTPEHQHSSIFSPSCQPQLPEYNKIPSARNAGANTPSRRANAETASKRCRFIVALSVCIFHRRARKKQDVSAPTNSRDGLNVQPRPPHHQHPGESPKALPPARSRTHHQLLADRIPTTEHVHSATRKRQKNLHSRDDHPQHQFPSPAGLPSPSQLCKVFEVPSRTAASHCQKGESCHANGSTCAAHVTEQHETPRDTSAFHAHQ